MTKWIFLLCSISNAIIIAMNIKMGRDLMVILLYTVIEICFIGFTIYAFKQGKHANDKKKQ